MSDKNIEVLQTHLDHWKRLLAEGICDKTEGEETIEAFQAAIAALKESCEAVSREAVLQGMYDLCNTGETLKENPWRDNPHIDAIIDMIENLPSVTPAISKDDMLKIDGLCEDAYEHGYEQARCDFETQPCEDCVSREAAKKLYCNICMDKNICYRDKEHCQELNLFDKLPSVIPKPTECEDAVSREHLLSGIDELMQSPWFNNGKDFYDGTNTHYGYVERKEAVEIVRDLCVKTEPLVTPKQKTGKWINNHTQCSICEWGMEDDVVGSAMMLFFPYCPNCGAKMEGESEKE